jgi:signal transduction histidine kinase
MRMTTNQRTVQRPAVVPERGVHTSVAAIENIAGGLGTAFLALFTLLAAIAVALLCLAGAGVLLIGPVLALVRVTANRERSRLNRWGYEIINPYPTEPRTARELFNDPATLRDLMWLGVHATLGLFIGFIGILLPVVAARDISFPLWWHLLPPDQAGASLGFPATTWPAAIAVGMMGLGWFAIIVGLGQPMARLQALAGVRLLGPHPSVDLSGRIAELTATRAATLEAHTAELRRIERSLHDGVQNRLVGMVMLVGAARQFVQRDPANADDVLERVQTAAEQALQELRSVVRGILPPVLENEGLDGAMAGLAAGCAVPCHIEVHVTGRCASSVEATAYFVVAEALTNIARHSGATKAVVHVQEAGDRLRLRIEDDGRGGAEEQEGTGILGMRRRIEAHDGAFDITSPAGGPTRIEVELPRGT